MTSEESKTNAFDRQRHVHFFAYSLRQLPGAYGKLDTNRLTLVHFCVHALDLLGVWEASYQQEYTLSLHESSDLRMKSLTPSHYETSYMQIEEVS